MKIQLYSLDGSLEPFVLVPTHSSSDPLLLFDPSGRTRRGGSATIPDVYIVGVGGRSQPTGFAKCVRGGVGFRLVSSVCLSVRTAAGAAGALLFRKKWFFRTLGSKMELSPKGAIFVIFFFAKIHDFT